ncbi:hypothetical protein LOZ65_004262 [Ophidiomyces ophidiicola]|nr:hypothetical protein LOZ65_004262 [Ophidiomyces ophidiicola]
MNFALRSDSYQTSPIARFDKTSEMKTIRCEDAISAMAEQAERFATMSITFAKSPELAESQANKIGRLTRKLASAITKIQDDAQTAANVLQGRLQATIRELSTQGNATKKKILENNKLDTRRTVKANFRLAFGPPKHSEYCSKTKKYAMESNAARIKTVRELCENFPDAALTLSTSYPTKVWTESSTDVFEGLIKVLKDETKVGDSWPHEILHIMDELEEERPMCEEFRVLRNKLSQRQARLPQRNDQPSAPSPVYTQLRPITSGATRALQIQYPSTRLPSLQQIGSTAPVFYQRQVRESPYSNFNFGQPTSPNSGRDQPGTYHSTANPSHKRKLEDPQLGFRENREVGFIYTNAPAVNISQLSEPFRAALQTSRQWKWERSQNMETTSCLATLFPKDNTQDVSLTIWCGNEDAYSIVAAIGMQLVPLS